MQAELFSGLHAVVQRLHKQSAGNLRRQFLLWACFDYNCPEFQRQVLWKHHNKKRTRRCSQLALSSELTVAANPAKLQSLSPLPPPNWRLRTGDDSQNYRWTLGFYLMWRSRVSLENDPKKGEIHIGWGTRAGAGAAINIQKGREEKLQKPSRKKPSSRMSFSNLPGGVVWPCVWRNCVKTSVRTERRLEKEWIGGNHPDVV